MAAPTVPTGTAGSGAGAYQFAQPPSAMAPSGRGLFRDPGAIRRPQNIMYDRRVVRGNTFAQAVVPPSVTADLERKHRSDVERERRRLAESRRSMAGAAAARAGTPEPVPGRVHSTMQTETYLEVISDREPEMEVGVQTDAMLDRPPTPTFVPKPSGLDAWTQVEDGELFDFDFEVGPVLEVLVGKTLETALVEVLQEDEMHAIRVRQEEFEAVRNAELAEVQRLEGEVNRRQREKAARLEQARVRVARQHEVQRKVAASAFARSLLSTIHMGVMGKLHTEGYFVDPVRRDVEAVVLPEVYAAVAHHTALRSEAAVALVDDLIAAALARGAAAYQALLDAAEAAEAARVAAELEAVARAAAEAQAAEAAKAALAAAAGVSGEGDEGEEAGDDEGGEEGGEEA